MKKVMKWFPMLCAVLIFMGAGVLNVHAENNTEDTIYEGVYFNGISLAGMTKEDAEMMMKDYVEDLLEQKIIFRIENRYVEIMPSDIGLQWMNQNLAAEAYSVGRTGNLIKRFKEQKDLEAASVELRTVFAADENLLRTFLNEKQKTLCVESKNWSLMKEGNNFITVPGSIGAVLNVENTYSYLVDFFANEYVPGKQEIELVADITEPLGSEEELALVRDLLGSFSTIYMTETPGRNQNVENGASKINGWMVYPGETFSVHDAVTPFTAENGYGVGFAYENGNVVESYGGGICQVSTTLYNAVLRAELEITQRAPHSMIVGYVQPAEDAAIAGTHKDLKFVNNLEHPVYIEGYTKDGVLYFNIYGVETRSSNRVVEFEPEILEITFPDPVITEVDEPFGYVKCLQDIHIGYKACLWKVVYENGVQISKEKVNNSTYAQSPARYEVGMKTDNEEAIEEMREAIEETIRTGQISHVLEVAEKYSELDGGSGASVDDTQDTDSQEGEE